LTLEVHSRLKKTSLHYMGNVEGGDLFSGEVDVIVCDGFVGNIALKICEGLAVQIFGLLRKSLRSSLITQFAGLLSQGVFRGLKKTIDYTEYGGAPAARRARSLRDRAWTLECECGEECDSGGGGIGQGEYQRKIEQGLFAAGASA